MVLEQFKKSEVLDQFTPKNYQQHVVVLMGGLSNEREVSLSSGRGVFNSLKKLGKYKATAVDMGNDLPILLNNLKPDVVYNSLHGPYGEDGKVQGLLDIMKIPYTHSNALASAICMNKEICNNFLSTYGINIPKRKIIDVNEEIPENFFPKPYVIKPISEGSSIGIEIVLESDNYDIHTYVKENGNKFGDRIIVEEFIPGREIQVAIFNDKAIDVLEIITDRKFYDFEAKYAEGGSKHVIPVEMDKEKYDELLLISEKIHYLLGCKDISRVEFRYNDNPKVNKFYFLEINTHPGFTPTSIVPEVCAYQGISYEDIVETLVRNAKCY